MMNEDNARIIRLRESLLNNYYEKLITKKQLYSYGSSLGFSKKFIDDAIKIHKDQRDT